MLAFIPTDLLPLFDPSMAPIVGGQLGSGSARQIQRAVAVAYREVSRTVFSGIAMPRAHEYASTDSLNEDELGVPLILARPEGAYMWMGGPVPLVYTGLPYRKRRVFYMYATATKVRNMIELKDQLLVYVEDSIKERLVVDQIMTLSRELR
jgi:hypothetical protein